MSEGIVVGPVAALLAEGGIEPVGEGEATPGEGGVSFAALDGASAVLVAARVAGTVGDVLGGMDPVSVAAGRLAGRVETLLWAQGELQLELERLREDRFADTRQLESFLLRVQDSLARVQDGSGTWDGLVRTAVDASVAGGTAVEGVPDTEMGD